jgi:hypothetical protein
MRTTVISPLAARPHQSPSGKRRGLPRSQSPRRTRFRPWRTHRASAGRRQRVLQPPTYRRRHERADHKNQEIHRTCGAAFCLIGIDLFDDRVRNHRCAGPKAEQKREHIGRKGAGRQIKYSGSRRQHQCRPGQDDRFAPPETIRDVTLDLGLHSNLCARKHIRSYPGTLAPMPRPAS